MKKIILTRLKECHQIGVIKPADDEKGGNTVAHPDKSCPVASSIFNRSSYDYPEEMLTRLSILTLSYRRKGEKII